MTNWTLQREQQEKLKLMEYWWDWVDSGKSFEELKIIVDVLAAGGAIPERACEVSHEVLELIRKAVEQGLSRHEAIGYLRKLVTP